MGNGYQLSILSAVFVFLSAILAEKSRCPEWFERYYEEGNMCININTHGLPYEEAIKHCNNPDLSAYRGRGMRLVQIDDSAKHNFIVSFARISHSNYWLDGKRGPRNVTHLDDRPLGYVEWGRDQPGVEGDCLALSSERKYKMDRCDNRFYFFCESAPLDCKIDNGGCQHSCEFLDDLKTECSCRTGFKLVDVGGYKCVDIDECKVKSPGLSCDQVCVNTVGSYTCGCREGYHVQKKGDKCEKEELRNIDIMLIIIIPIVLINLVVLMLFFRRRRMQQTKLKQEMEDETEADVK